MRTDVHKTVSELLHREDGVTDVRHVVRRLDDVGLRFGMAVGRVHDNARSFVRSAIFMRAVHAHAIEHDRSAS